MEAATGPTSGSEEVGLGSSGRGRLPVQRPRREPRRISLKGKTMVAAFNLIAGARHVGEDVSLDRLG
jgi:hypothetical protein